MALWWTFLVGMLLFQLMLPIFLLAVIVMSPVKGNQLDVERNRFLSFLHWVYWILLLVFYLASSVSVLFFS